MTLASWTFYTWGETLWQLPQRFGVWGGQLLPDAMAGSPLGTNAPLTICRERDTDLGPEAA